MDSKLFEEVLYLLDELAQDTTVPKNVRKTAVITMKKKSVTTGPINAAIIALPKDVSLPEIIFPAT